MRLLSGPAAPAGRARLELNVRCPTLERPDLGRSSGRVGSDAVVHCSNGCQLAWGPGCFPECREASCSAYMMPALRAPQHCGTRSLHSFRSSGRDPDLRRSLDAGFLHRALEVV